jgi:hypothetical protein
VEQAWFEMPEVRRRKLADAVWIPLRAIYPIRRVGEHGHCGYTEEFYGVGTLAVPIENKADADKLNWHDVGISYQHSGRVQDGKYIPADVYDHYGGRFLGLHLVLDQRGSQAENPEWHLNQDFVVTIGLKREGDIWVRPDEGYIEVARLSRKKDGSPSLLEVRASHLRDYLCARGMSLYVTSYRSRVEIVEDAGHISWPKSPVRQIDNRDRWEGRVTEIHEGGMPFGGEIAVFHVSRTDVDPEQDVPVMGPPTDGNVASRSWKKKHAGRKLYRIQGELWRSEWIEPASKSPIVRNDEIPSTVSFIVDAEGKKETKDTLVEGGRWLWFRPEVVCALLDLRGGSLKWYTRDTGSVSCSPGYAVHFGVNSLGLVNVYAKDIGLLPEWQQRIWAGYNVGPDGKVSGELLASQVRAEPAGSQAPEEFLAEVLSLLNDRAKAKLGIRIFRHHSEIPKLLARTHRFRATDKEGLFALAKDVARLTADSIDSSELQKLVAPPKDAKWGSLKSLEHVLATKIGPDDARTMLSPLVGIYELRLADAHLPSPETGEAMQLVGIKEQEPYVTQGYQLLHACVSSLYSISKVVEDSW